MKCLLFCLGMAFITGSISVLFWFVVYVGAMAEGMPPSEGITFSQWGWIFLLGSLCGVFGIPLYAATNNDDRE